MVTRLKTFSLIITILILLSCNEKGTIEKGIIGEYSIVYIAHKDTDLLYNLTLNIIEFNKNGTVKLPGIISRNNHLREDKTLTGTWKVYEKDSNFFIEIETTNYYFKDIYEVSFGVNKEKEALQVLLFSKKLTIGAEKNSFNSERNKSFVEKLIKVCTTDSIKELQ